MSKLILAISFLFISFTSQATTYVGKDSSDSLKMEDIKKAIFHIQPSSYLLQTGGDIGLVSIGAGWEYGKNKQWATEVLLGFVPKYDTDRVKFTLNLRQVYSPWKLPLNQSITYKPLRTGLYLSTTLGKQFWYSAPEKYPKDYYTFSTKLRANIFVGQSFSFELPEKVQLFRKVDFYYDVHVSDLMLISRIQNKSLSGFNSLGLALGVKVSI